MPTDFDNDDFFEGQTLVKRQKQSGISLVSLNELFREPPEVHRWLVKDLVIASGITLLCGRPKSLKSHWVRQLVLSVASGVSFLGKDAVQGSVIYIAVEEKRSEIRRHFELMGANGNEPIFIHTGVVHRPSLNQLGEIVEKTGVKLVVIDTLMRFIHLTDICDYGLVTRALEPLIDLARSGVAVLLVHHTAKASFADVNDSALGSTALTGSVDGIVNLLRRGDSVSMSSRQRYAPDFPETYLEFDVGSRMLSLGTPKTEADIDRLSKATLALLTESSDPLTEVEIEKSVIGPTAAKRSSLRRLVEMGTVQRTGVGGKSDPYRYGLS